MTNEEEVLEGFEETEQVESEVVSEQKEESVEDESKKSEPEDSEVTLDDLDNVAPKDKTRVINEKDVPNIPEVLTISAVKLGKCYPTKEDGTPNEPEENANGGLYYKSKLKVEVEELINDSKIRFFIPSIFYSVKDGVIQKIPTVPKACKDDKLNDNFTPTLAKVRNKHAKKVGKEASEISSVEFLKSLVGMKFQPDIKEGTHKGKDWITLNIKDFI